MANHGYISVKKKINPKILGEALREISEKRFGGCIEIEAVKDSKEGWGRGTHIIYTFERGGVGHPIWFRSPKKLEIRHGGCGDLDTWIEAVFINDLALKFDGIISDDGISDRWKGEEGKYPTLMAWLEAMYPKAKGIPFIGRQIIGKIIRDAGKVRPDLKKWFR